MAWNRTVVALSGFALVCGCFDPETVDADTDTSTGAESETAAGSGASSSQSATESTTSTSTTDDTDTPTTASSTTVDPTDPTESSSGPGAACGNGDMEGDEECDDGDLEAGDGCSAACLDETNFCDPGLVGALNVTGPDLKRLAVKDDHLYGLRFSVPSELVVIDIADPTDPSSAGNLEIDSDNYPNWNPGDLLVAGDHLWTAGRNPELMSIDIGTPTDPMFDFFAGPNDSDGPIEILGDLLYQARSVSEQIRGWDISDPSAPIGLPAIGNPSQVFRDVAAFGTTVIAIAGSHAEIWDVSTPAVPVFTGELDGAPWAQTVRSAANADTVVLATVGDGVGIIDYSNPNVPTAVGTIPGESSPRDIGLRGTFAFVPVTNGLRVYDVSNPASPALAAAYLEVDVFGTAIAFSADHVYLATESGLRVLGDMPGFCEARCGNNTVEYPEGCDDGNLDDGDGCSSACADE